VTKSGCLSRQAVEIFGGASRDRTDDLIVANDGVCQIISLTCLHLAVKYGPLRSNSTIQACGVCLTYFSPWFELLLSIMQPSAGCCFISENFVRLGIENSASIGRDARAKECCSAIKALLVRATVRSILALGR